MIPDPELFGVLTAAVEECCDAPPPQRVDPPCPICRRPTAEHTPAEVAACLRAMEGR